MVEIILFYWPKLVAGAWFALFNFLMGRKNDNKGRLPAVLHFLVLFLCSSAVVSLIAELFSYEVYYYIFITKLNMALQPLAYVVLQIFIDGIFIVIGGFVFSKTSNLHSFKGAAIYMQFVCIERLAIIIAVEQWGLLVLLILFQSVVIFTQWKFIPLVESVDRYNWRRMFIYLTFLFYVLDVLYGAFYIFPELKTNEMDITNLVWLDSIAFVSSAFVLGFIHSSLKEIQQEHTKLQYLEKLQHNQEDLVVALTEIMGAKSDETGQHIRRVAEYSCCMAERLLKDEMEIQILRTAAMMHDIGKLMIPQEILFKPERLSMKDYEVVKKHARYGWDLLAKSKEPMMKMARTIAYEHHEHWDGNGYPKGLKGNEISIYAQIVAVADVYDALTSKRCYREAWKSEDAAAEIVQNKGKKFAPQVVDVFVSRFDDIEAIRLQYADEA
ncbi:MAG: HD-GYP domain-containing protein [Lachnospiraceae bacterium]|nr:HD-GYP domain-containing protein [Lachnospiraceae bacterium]